MDVGQRNSSPFSIGGAGAPGPRFFEMPKTNAVVSRIGQRVACLSATRH